MMLLTASIIGIDACRICSEDSSPACVKETRDLLRFVSKELACSYSQDGRVRRGVLLQGISIILISGSQSHSWSPLHIGTLTVTGEQPCSLIFMLHIEGLFSALVEFCD